MTEPAASATGRYAVTSELGRGGMGAVYRATDLRTGRDVALKRLRLSEDAKRNGKYVEFFHQEFRTLAQLAHPNVVAVHDFGADEHGPYYTMELLEGEDLHALAPLPWGEACALMRDVCSAVALLHSRRLLHRDLSPRNVKRTARPRQADRLRRDGADGRVQDTGRHAAAGAARSAAAAAARRARGSVSRSAARSTTRSPASTRIGRTTSRSSAPRGQSHRCRRPRTWRASRPSSTSSCSACSASNRSRARPAPPRCSTAWPRSRRYRATSSSRSRAHICRRPSWSARAEPLSTRARRGSPRCMPARAA